MKGSRSEEGWRSHHSKVAAGCLLLLCSLSVFGVDGFAPPTARPSVVVNQQQKMATTITSSTLFGKKKKKGGGGGYGGGGGQRPQEKQSVKDARFDAATRQFMFTMVGLSKILPDKSKKILDNIVSCLEGLLNMFAVGLDVATYYGSRSQWYFMISQQELTA